MKKMFLPIIFLPFFVFAAESFGGLVDQLVNNYFKNIFVLLITLSTFFMFYSIFKLIVNEGKEKDILKDRVIWSIIAVALFASAFGVVNILSSTFNLDNSHSNPAGNIDINELNNLDIPEFGPR